jgi:gamma-glutamyl hercynylcysteine S-oxide synthase
VQPSVDSPVAARTGGRDWISLALIDSRNRSLRWLARFEATGALHGSPGLVDAPLRRIGRAGWFQEFWIARHVQRARGEAGDASALRLASSDPRADDWFDPARGLAWDVATAPSPEEVRTYLEATLETTLDLLAAARDDDAGLHVFRLALLAEDRLAESLAEAAEALEIDPAGVAVPCGPAPARVEREPLWMPARRHPLGAPRGGGLVPANERWAHEIAVPEFEIDAQAVSWRRFVEFAEDGGYDREELWSRDGWAWLQVEGRRAPRGVEQLRGAVLLQRRGQVQRAPAGQAVVHASWYEADAWCRWAGRRLPTEVEWELAACTAASRGFVWGDVWEWAAGSARAWPNDDIGFPAGFSPVPPEAPRRVLRGASTWTVPRAVHPTSRRFMPPGRDLAFCGFRSCAI